MDSLNTILKMPERSLVNKKITKAFFKRNFDLTGSEMALLDDFSIVKAIDWLASVNPANSNVNFYKDEAYLFEEVQIIGVQTSVNDFERNQQRISDLIQKFIPYPILLCIWSENAFVLSTSDKKINQNDNSRRTIEKKYNTEQISITESTERQKAFLKGLAFAELDKTNLRTYYESYTQRIIALQTSELSGVYEPRSLYRTKSDLQRLEQIESLQNEIQLLQNQAKQETQLNQRVALNTQIQSKRKEIEQLKALITA